MPGGDDQSDWGDEDHTDILDVNSAMGMVETLDQLQLRTAREGGCCYVKNEAQFYIFKDGKWQPEDDDE